MKPLSLPRRFEFSAVSLLPFLCLVLVLLSVSYRGMHVTRVIWSDAEGYYLYLPALLIHGGFEGFLAKTGSSQFQFYPGTEKIFTPYTCGVALLQLPFFLLAHVYALLTDAPATGYSAPYAIAIKLAAAFYATLACYLLFRVIRRHFSTAVALLNLTCLYLGTNLFYYTVVESGMSHVYSFFLVSLLLYLTPRLLSDNSTRGIFVLYGVCCGLIALIRPNNAVFGLYLLLYEVHSWSQFKARILHIVRHFGSFCLIPLAALPLLFPQMLYWHHVTGHWIMYSYGNQSFIYWNEPKVLQVLFSSRNGWLLYSPIMLFALVGLFEALFKRRFSSIAVLIILAAAIYVFSSWWSWWFGGAFGHRCFVEYLPLLALPLAYFINFLLRSGYRINYVMGAFMLFFIFYNLKLTYIYWGPFHYAFAATTWPEFFGLLNLLFAPA
ncbi:hypothetical protein SAMN05421823_101173 [Catalinimonas alkaloidigena]|uniref:Glycosyltransferase RgtA/B/C/D-like domain-containing protein n=1 Tax=Catalinimonas alkaloidigena TaxID=1075417 RepID=A0A1G8WS93_9BACT|nr:hypothetical protein [Catalinimonas alkaloidigena]SDJ81262.1 hypothetical protein SAMN05421823_101173 [Catalinimonas alkaloidigena]